MFANTGAFYAIASVLVLLYVCIILNDELNHIHLHLKDILPKNSTEETALTSTGCQLYDMPGHV